MNRNSLVVRILIGFVAGTLIGLFLSKYVCAEVRKDVLAFVAPFGKVLVAMLKMVVYPIIFFTLVQGAAALPLKRSGRVGGMVMIWYFATSLFATLFGVALAYMMNPTLEGAAGLASEHLSQAQHLAEQGARAGTFGDFIVGMFQNPFAALANGQFLAIIVFAIATGFAARALMDAGGEMAERVKPFVAFVDAAAQVVIKLVDWVVLYFPIGVFALSVANFAENGTLLFGPYLRITACVILGVVLMIFVVYPLAIAAFLRENPYRVLARIKSAMLAAFVTRSSAAALPVSFRVMDEAGVDRSLSSFSLPMGATVNMDGVCVHLPVFALLAANMFHHPLSAVSVAALCLSIMFASVGAGGIPGGSVFLLFMVLENMGLTGDQVTLVVALAMGINPILDMFETCCNVTGDNVCTYIVARRSGMAS